MDKLAEQLSDDQFKHLKAAYPEHWELLSKKGIYSYDYMNSMERCDETSLPSKDHFFNKLYDRHVSKEQYGYAENVWKTLVCNTMKDYHNHYLITDILLLADVFENFTKMSLETYGLDPIHYYSLPGLSWDAMLKYTGVELELITDPDMHIMAEKSMRGGISNICHRYATANHPSMDTYNENEDANSLYSWTMSQMLPLKGFKWIPNEIDISNV